MIDYLYFIGAVALLLVLAASGCFAVWWLYEAGIRLVWQLVARSLDGIVKAWRRG